MKSRTFVDCVSVQARAGRGGNGSNSFRREACVEMGGPDGGDGGRGGHILFRASHDEDSLLRLYYSPILQAQDGGPGRGQQMHGRNAPDVVFKVPCGTQVYDEETGELLFDLVDDGQEVIAAEGGRGGLGNVHWKTSTHQAPTEFTPGAAGQERRLRLELKLMADAGLVGFPNAGKSSILTAISDAHPKIGAYPFTTINPIIGTVCYPDFSQIRVADIPGLVEGAHAGVGLGDAFLRHLARSRLLVYVVDVGGGEGRRPWDDYRALRREIGLHDPALLKLPSVLVANKTDLPDAAANLPLLARRANRKVIAVSTVDGSGIEELKDRLHALLKPQPAGKPSPAGRPSRGNGLDEEGNVTAERLKNAGFFDLKTRMKG